ncbi:MAG: hypothetical protein QXR53_00290 [Candidatus Norongarragalinales archaeon]
MASCSPLWKHPLLAGIAGGSFLLAVFFGLMLATNPWDVAAAEFKRLFPWIAALVMGFATQAYLYATLKKSIAEKTALAKAKGGVAAAGGMSTGAMVACCAHHFTDALPFVGLAAFATVLSRYQELFLIIGVLSNVVGIIMMLGVFKKIRIGGKYPVIRHFSAAQFDFAFKASIVASVAIIAAYAARFLE